MNDRQIAFIMCVNDDRQADESEFYIRCLEVPEQYEVDVIRVREAESMTAGYNAAMENSDARYKVYLHQDTRIIAPGFIRDMINVFKNDDTIGMLGCVGCRKLPANGQAVGHWDVGMVYHNCIPGMLTLEQDKEQPVEVEALDGLLLATSRDVRWREDLFDGWDFYDVSQAFEFRRAGYEIVVPYQEEPWVVHDCGFAKLTNYDRNRKICMEEYPEFFNVPEGEELFSSGEWDQLSSQLAAAIRRMIDQGQWDEASQAIGIYHQSQMKSSELEMLAIICEIEQTERRVSKRPSFLAQAGSCEAICRTYLSVRFLLHRMEFDRPAQDYQELIHAVESGNISVDAILILILHGVLDKEKVLGQLETWHMPDPMSAERLRSFHRRMKKENRGIPYSYSKRAKMELEKYSKEEQ